MGILDRLFGGNKGAGSGIDVATGVAEICALDDDPEAKSEGGLSITGRQANEIRNIGRRLHKAGGKANMEAVRDGVREQVPWAAKNLEAIWADLPEWKS
jgi:hypothetical protein